MAANFAKLPELMGGPPPPDSVATRENGDDLPQNYAEAIKTDIRRAT
jgi:hypothetical protein